MPTQDSFMTAYNDQQTERLRESLKSAGDEGIAITPNGDVRAMDSRFPNAPLGARLYATVGLPRSGKSTLCREVYMKHGYVVINPDQFRIAIHGQRFVASLEPFVWSVVYAAVDALLLTGHKVIVDACLTSKKRRDPWEQRGAMFILMGTTREVCEQRASDANDPYILPIIDRMAKECDWPAAVGLKG